MAIWRIFLIALYWSSQYVVETVPLPNEHLEEAILCLKEYIGDDILPELFGKDLRHGEYLGEICKYEKVEILEEKINKDTKDGGLKIQECLAKKKLPEVYTKILNYGIEVLVNEERLKELEEEHERSQGLQPQTSTSQDTQLEDEKHKQSHLGTDITSLHESQKIPEEDSDKRNSEKYSDFAKYIIGLCQKDYSVDYQNLENDQDKETAFSCLEDCAMKFMWRIEKSLNKTIDNIAQIMKNNQESILQNVAVDSDKVPDSGPKLTRRIYDGIINKFIDLTMIDKSADSLIGAFSVKKRKISEDDTPSSSARIFDIDTITTTGKPLMTRYSQVYGILYKYLDETDTLSNENIHPEVKRHLDAITIATNEEKILNRNLRNSFIYYEYCAKVQCYMKAPESVPLYVFIHDEVTKEYTGIMQGVQKPWPEKKFYIVLTHQFYSDDHDIALGLGDEDEDDDDDDDDNDSFSDEEEATM